MIVDNDGTIIERLSFNAWGKRRNWRWNEFDEEITSSSNIGFTGHKMDDEVGLVNMKARIYDPVIGRFLSPDSIIPNTKRLQSYNRYSYVRNNPLSFTDPTGHEREAPARIIYDCGECRDGSFNRTTVKVYTGKGYKKVGTYNNKQVAQIRNAVRQVTDPGLKQQTSTRVGAAAAVVTYYSVPVGLYSSPGAGGPPGSGGGGGPGGAGPSNGGDGPPGGAGIGPSGPAGASGGVSVGDGTSNDPTSDNFGIGGNNPGGIGVPGTASNPDDGLSEPEKIGRVIGTFIGDKLGKVFGGFLGGMFGGVGGATLGGIATGGSLGGIVGGGVAGAAAGAALGGHVGGDLGGDLGGDVGEGIGGAIGGSNNRSLVT